MVDKLLEIHPIGTNDAEIVWEGNPWNHCIQNANSEKQNYGNPAEHPEKVLISLVRNKEWAHQHANQWVRNKKWTWLHMNSVDDHEERNQIMLSCRNISEIWVNDHPSLKGPQEGRGTDPQMGGIRYRWGNPANYGMAEKGEQQLFWQHDAQWIDPGLQGAGNILIFTNGTIREPEKFSTIV